MESDLFTKICDDIKARTEWATRQPLWYRLRREGVRRRDKPWPHASDKHFPLIDMAIQKLKPTCLNQVFATERIADFIASDPQDNSQILDVAWWFDYKMRQMSNFEDEIDLVMDFMYVYGRGVMKVFWDPIEKRISFDAIEPIFIIVPDYTKDMRTAEYLVHVKHLSEWEYRNGIDSDLYNQDDSFIKNILTSRDGSDQGDEDFLVSAKRLCEGITHTSEKDTIIIWETYERTVEGYLVHTISPLRYKEDVRPAFKLPLEGRIVPFIDFPYEKTSKSFYGSRGIAEMGAPFQSYLCKTWNGKSDAIDLWNNPPLTATKDVPITQNIRSIPGSIIPFAVTPIITGAPPISWDTEMANTRDIAEQLFLVPDFGVGEKGFTSEKKKSSDRTATETNYLAGIMNQGVDMRNRIFRRKLGFLYNLAWDILYESDEDMEYLHDQEYKTLDKKVRDRIQSLRPSGSAGSWNTGLRFQKAVQRKMMLGNSPFVKLHELDKMVMELDEPGLVERLYRDPGVRERDQKEAQFKEIPVLMEGMPITPKPDDDHMIHAQAAMQYIAQAVVKGKKGEAMGMQQMMEHVKTHLAELAKVNPQMASKLQKEFQAAMQQAMQKRQQVAMQQAQGANGQRRQQMVAQEAEKQQRI